MKKNPALAWFRRDLRIDDNPALAAAAASNQPVIAVFIWEDHAAWAPGGASLWWLHHALQNLHTDLKKLGTPLILRRGKAEDIIPALVTQTGATSIFWNRRYHQAERDTDSILKSRLTNDGVLVKSFNGSLVREPWEVKTGSDTHYKVFTPFWKSIKPIGPTRSSLAPTPEKLIKPEILPESDTLDDWSLLPTSPNWATSFTDYWSPAKTTPHELLEEFLSGPAANYDDDRNRPDKAGTSRLSPYLAWGQISPVQIWQTTQTAIANKKTPEDQALKFLSEVIWRDFSYNLLYHYPDIPHEPLKKEFADFPWQNDDGALRAWQRGQTGYPIVDAGMRELWQTGWMHNRVRMIVASFLIKDLLIHWREGEKWFWDCLVDADIANNAASWQWVAGSGADAAPYFRIFNPITQGEKFDPNAEYIRQFVPELADMPDKYIHKPWTAPEDILENSGIKLGDTYPHPIVDHGEARKLALAGYDAIRNK